MNTTENSILFMFYNGMSVIDEEKSGLFFPNGMYQEVCLQAFTQLILSL